MSNLEEPFPKKIRSFTYSKKDKVSLLENKRAENKSVWELANSKKRCFVCTKPLVGNPSFLNKAKTKHSNATFASCLKDIANNKFPVKIAVDDRCCCKCASLLQQKDQLERELEMVNNTIFTYLKASCTVRTFGNPKNTADTENTSVLGTVTKISMDEDRSVDLESDTSKTVLYECGSCQKLFNSIADLNKHGCFENNPVTLDLVPSRKNTRNYPCIKCPSSFTTVLALYAHAKTHEQVPKVEKIIYKECKKCNLMFPSDDMLQEHLETHDKFRCSSCNKQFKDKDAFDKHLTLVAKLQQDFCISCGKIFSSKTALLTHLAESHGDSDSSEHQALRVIYICPCCNVELPDVKTLNEHKFIHLMISIDDEIAGPSNAVQEKAINSSDKWIPVEPELVKKNSVSRKRPNEVNKENSSVSASAKTASIDHSYSLEMPESAGEEEVVHLFSSNASNDESKSANEPAPKTTPDKKAEEKSKPCVFECGMCDVRATSVNNLLEHFKTHKDQPISCKHCNIKMPSISALSKHLQYHVKSGQGIECLMCRKPLSSKDQLLKHMHDFHKYRQQCVHCGEQFRYASDLSTHKVLHPESRLFMCLFCNERFTSMLQLDKHQALVHRDPKCNICGKEIQDRRKLREHEQRHSKDLNPCTKCERIFKTPSGLKNHLASHTGEYKYRCDTCQKGFTNRSIFREHVNNHLEHPELLYKCRYCDKAFSYQGSWWIHEKWHKNPYPYQCKLCGKKLRHSSILAAHMRKHRGERPYKCPHCTLSVSSASTFKRHMMLHTGNYAFNCQECKKGFTTKQKFHQHQYTVHGIPLPVKKISPYKISLGIPADGANTYEEDTMAQDEAAIAYIVGDFEENTTGDDQGMPAVLEVVTDEQQQAVSSLELLDENSSSWTVGRA